MQNGAKLAIRDPGLQIDPTRMETAIVTQSERNPGRLYRRNRRDGRRTVEGEWLFAENMLSGHRRRDDLLGMQQWGRGQDDGINIVTRQQRREPIDQIKTMRRGELLIFLAPRASRCRNKGDLVATLHGIYERTAPPTEPDYPCLNQDSAPTLGWL